ncbi:MAG TPA: alpha/beta hydrolase [Pyrinomonadaceae bacterium]|nr:alpha/beta hydrolase [Pyrinomonadaceae bacterium]
MKTLFLIIALLFASTAIYAADGESQFAKLDGARIHYKNFGKGSDAMVLVHGWTGNLDNWRDQIQDFAKRNRVIALDLPGHGQSDKPQITYTMDVFANAIDAVMRDAKVEHAVLVGHSMGTPVARQFYRKYPQKTLAIVIVDGGLRLFGTKEMRDGFLTMFRSPGYKEAGSQFLAQMMKNLPAAELERANASFANTPQHVLVSAMESMNNEALYGPDKINVPVFAVIAKSPFWPPDTDQFLRGLAPDLELQWWDGVGHFLMMEKPKQFNDAVIAFLNKKNLLK